MLCYFTFYAHFRCVVVYSLWVASLQCRHNGHDGVSNHQPRHCLLNRLFRRRWNETPKTPCHWPLVRGIHRWPVNSPHKWPVTRKISIWSLCDNWEGTWRTVDWHTASVDDCDGALRKAKWQQLQFTFHLHQAVYLMKSTVYENLNATRVIVGVANMN